MHFLPIGFFALYIYSSNAQILGNLSAIQTCTQISNKISSDSEVIYALNPDFGKDINHYFLSSTQVPTCVLEAGNPHDISEAIKIIGSSRTPFAVESGGHASNPGFSSTNGVHISLRRLSQVDISSDKSTVKIGMGLTWADVYKKIQGTGINVVGGRVPGPGVGGYTLGGGYSWKTNQFGLTCDTIKSYTLVLPNGTITQIDSSQSNLFFALKGGLNRFGIVTSAQYRSHQQVPKIYGGYNIYSATETPAILNATATFYSQNKDPKAQIITTLYGSAVGTTAIVLFFYDGPEEPASFAPFDKIIPAVDAVKSQDFSSFISSIPSQLAEAANFRGRFDTLSTAKLTPDFVKAVENETSFYGSIMSLHGGITVSYDMEPFLHYGDKATESAYPHANSPLPLNVYFSWASESNDQFWINAMQQSVKHLRSVAAKEGIEVDVPKAYPNYAIAKTSANDLYGAKNAARLRNIRDRVDPDHVMELTGGFNI